MTKRILLMGLPILLLFSSCKTIKPNESSTKMLSVKKIVKAYEKASFSKNTLQAKIKVRYKDPKTAQSAVVKLRLKKDEIIWMSGSFLGIPLAKVKITPTSVQYYEKITRTYFDGDFSLISEVLGTELNFDQLQNMLLGQSMLPLDNKYELQMENNSYLLTPKKQALLFNMFCWINPMHFKVDKQILEDTSANQTLSILYSNYQELSNENLPKNIHIKAVQSKKVTSIEMEYRNVEFDKELRYPFEIPSNYKKINLIK